MTAAPDVPPWWGGYVLAGAFTVIGGTLVVTLEWVRQRSTRWDERRLDLFVRITGHLHDGLEALQFLELETTSPEAKVELRATAQRAYVDLKPLVRELSLLQMSSIWFHVQQAHVSLLASSRDVTNADLSYLSSCIHKAEQGMRAKLGTPVIKLNQFKNPVAVLKTLVTRAMDAWRRDA